MKTIKILGYDYTVDMTKGVDEIDAAGRFHSTKQIIQIANNNVLQQQESTLIHEILEALNYHLQLELEHNKIMALEAGFYQVLKDNGVDLSVMLDGIK